MNQSTAKIILIQNMHRVWGIDSEGAELYQ